MATTGDFLFFVAAFSLAAFSPGPGIAAIVATVLAEGARRTVSFCVGVIAGDLTWLILLLSGLALVAQQIPVVFVVIKWAGITYLLYLATKMWRSSPAPVNNVEQPSQKGITAQVLTGFIITMGNPKAMLFYLAILPSIVHPGQVSLTMALFLCLAVIAVLATVFTVYVLAAEKARHTMANSHSVQKFNRITATALGGTAICVAAR